MRTNKGAIVQPSKKQDNGSYRREGQLRPDAPSSIRAQAEISGLKTLIHTLIKTSADEPKDGWLNGGRAKTRNELDQEALEYVQSHKQEEDE